MARRPAPLPTTRQSFDALTKGIGEILYVYEQLTEGKISELSGFVDLILGPSVRENTMLELEDIVAKMWESASETVLDDLAKAMEADTHVAGFLEAAGRIQEDVAAGRATVEEGIDITFPNRVADLQSARKRLAKLTSLYDEYQDEGIDPPDPSPVTQQISGNRFTVNRGFRMDLEEGYPYEEAKHELLEVSSNRAILAGAAFLQAARLAIAEEVLRLELKPDKSEPLYEDARFLSALTNAKRNLDRADLMRHNAWYAMPELERTFEAVVPDNEEEDDDNNDNNGGTGGSTPQPRRTLH